LNYASNYKENYLIYLIFEILLVGLTTAIMLVCFIFYITLKADTDTGSRSSDYLFSHPLLYSALCILPALASVLFIGVFRKRNYIVGWKIDNYEIQIAIRGLRRSNIETVILNQSDVRISKFEDQGFLIVPKYKGYRLKDSISMRTFDFVVNNFIWEKQIRDRVSFSRFLESCIHE
jgi:hypothetical protein